LEILKKKSEVVIKRKGTNRQTIWAAQYMYYTVN